MRPIGRLVLAFLAGSLAACDGRVTGLESVFGPAPAPPRDQLQGTVQFEPRSLSLRVGESADVTVRLSTRLRSLDLDWWGSADFPVVTVERDFPCEPEGSCGLARYQPDSHAVLQLQDSRLMRMRVVAIAAGRNHVVAAVTTCVPAIVFCGATGHDDLAVEVRP